MHELLESPEKLKNYLIQRLDALLADTVNEISISDRIRIEGNCNEIELMLLELFDVNTEQIELLKEKVRRSEEYYRLKYDGYCLTANSDGKHVTLKNGRIVEAKFWLVDNGVGDMQAVITAYVSQIAPDIAALWSEFADDIALRKKKCSGNAINHALFILFIAENEHQMRQFMNQGKPLSLCCHGNIDRNIRPSVDSAAVPGETTFIEINRANDETMVFKDIGDVPYWTI